MTAARKPRGQTNTALPPPVFEFTVHIKATYVPKDGDRPYERERVEKEIVDRLRRPLWVGFSDYKMEVSIDEGIDDARPADAPEAP